MVRPQEVNAPKEKIEVIAIIEDGVKSRKGYSIALVNWKGKKSIAVRWDGDSQLDKGFPITANGYHPAWFILPDKLTDLYSQDYVKLIEAREALEKLADLSNEEKKTRK
ncbi:MULTISPECIES: hypothetical protein [unclassified Enterococcus]|uniref:hypothetical protein n=1 Tax=unclassified Enterococcus TaxID=2608891 RepID=UPI0013EC97AD|nr:MULTISPECIES: hypothetical protein [unclassified Enterococcus]